MRYLKKYEEYTAVVYEEPKLPDEMEPTYKAAVKKKKLVKTGKGKKTVVTPPNHAKDTISFHKST